MSSVRTIIGHTRKYSCFQANRIFGYEPKIWLFGDGRSGTTWISNLINYDKYFRESFEPFHPEFIPEMKFLSSHLYVRPEEDDQRLLSVCEKVFKGSLWNARIDRENDTGIYRGLLVKDIFSNLFAKWVYQNFDDLSMIILVRNPFAVAASKYAKKDWTWVTDPMTLLNQNNLHNDYLSSHEDLFHRVCEENNYILNQILIWSVIHYIPFKQFNNDQLHVMFYENVFMNPHQEIMKLSKLVGKDFNSIPRSAIYKESSVVGDNIKNKKSPITSWMSELPTITIDKGMKIMEAFGLAELYDNSSMPNEFDIDFF